MTILLVAVAALACSLLTFFAGFGLGTLLLPVFAIFFPVPVAIAATAVVHLANNLFKAGLVGRNADWGVVKRFAIPAAIAAVVGASILREVSALAPIAAYSLGGRACVVTPVKLLVAVLMLLFAAIEVLPRFRGLTFGEGHFVVGGLLSGFFGGLSGHQGALRSAFLLKAGLTPTAFVATGAASSIVVDVSRLLVYGPAFFARDFAAVGGHSGRTLVLVAAAAAFLGTFAGTRFLRRMSLRAMQLLAGALLVAIALALGAGVI